MSFLWNLLDKGYSMPSNQTLGQRIALWLGRRMALRHRNVHLAATAKVSPRAMVHPRKDHLTIGDDSTIGPGAIVQGNITIGDHSSVQANTILVGYGEHGKITIGNYVRIAPQVMMIAANHVFADPEKPIHAQGLEAKPIVIEDDCWIAGRVNIMAGVTIGKGSVIGAGAVVTKDVPPYSIAVGVPAKVIASRKKNR
jgi:acetyltransferase-like isoleucine patch superfamily enzyme